MAKRLATMLSDGGFYRLGLLGRSSAGLREGGAMDVGWSDMLLSHELRDAVVACERG